MLEHLQRELQAAHAGAAQARTDARLPASPVRALRQRNAKEEGTPPDAAQVEQLRARNAQLEVRSCLHAPSVTTRWMRTRAGLVPHCNGVVSRDFVDDDHREACAFGRALRGGH